MKANYFAEVGFRNGILMKNLSVLMLILVLTVPICSCANFTTTGTSGTSFGMSKEAVIAVMGRRGYKVISQDEDTVVVEGVQEQLKQPSIKTFHFENGRLVSVSEKIV